MTVLQAVVLALVTAAATLTVLTRDPARQAVVSGFLGLALAALFFVFGAPDVALSAIVVGTVAIPVMTLLALARMQGTEDE
jgi:energy-converting hydrogenase B subunit D